MRSPYPTIIAEEMEAAGVSEIWQLGPWKCPGCGYINPSMSLHCSAQDCSYEKTEPDQPLVLAMRKAYQQST